MHRRRRGAFEGRDIELKYCLVIIRRDQLAPDVRLFITANQATEEKKKIWKNPEVVAIYLYKYVNDWRRYNGKNV